RRRSSDRPCVEIVAEEDMSDEIPAIETYRGVGIDDLQPPERIAVVKRAIDEVYGMTAIDRLLAYIQDITQPPETRRFAAEKLQAAQEVAAADRVARPDVDLQFVAACIAGLGSRGWRDPRAYGSLLDVPHAPGQPGPQPRPPEYQALVEEDRRLRHEEERAEGLRPRNRLRGDDD